MKKLIGVLLFALAFAGQALATELTVGAAANNGYFGFSLWDYADGSSLYVLAPVSAGDSGAVIASRIKATVNGGNWSATVDKPGGSTLTFFHSGRGILEIDCASNSASASTTLSSSGMHPGAVLQTPAGTASVVASGFDAKSKPSYLTVSVTGLAPYTVTLHPGQTGVSIMDGIALYLGTQATRISSTQILIVGNGALTVSLQTSDTGLRGVFALSEISEPPYGGPIGRRPIPLP